MTEATTVTEDLRAGGGDRRSGHDRRVAEEPPDPHVVHQDRKGLFTTERTKSPEGVVFSGRTYHGLQSCPDCGTGLTAREDGALVCGRLDLGVELKPCHDHCIIACGRARSDG